MNIYGILRKFNNFRLNLKVHLNLSNNQIIACGFMLVILLGAILLCLPVSSRSGNPTPFLDALFTSTTATCVTGLVVVDTYTHWSLFGQIVILFLIQIGGLGFMSLATLFSLMLRRTISFKQRMVMSESMSTDSTSGIVRMTQHILLTTLMFEGAGALILSIKFIPQFGVGEGIFKGIFHSISAFCNAGLDLMGQRAPFSSLTAYSGDWVVNITIMSLIIIGGIGFVVWEDIYHANRWRDLSMHSKLVIAMTIILVLGGAALIFMMDYHNPGTLVGLPFHEKISASLFQSVTARTAGFNTVNLSQLTTASTFVLMILMFIGGAPGSTAGGVKTTTIGVLVFTALSTMRGTKDINAFNRRLEAQAIRRAITIVLVAIGVVAVGVMVLSVCEPQFSFREIVFEVISAFATTGLTMGITPALSAVSKFTLILLMYFGRIGVLTLMLSLTAKGMKAGSVVRYPKGKILV